MPSGLGYMLSALQPTCAAKVLRVCTRLGVLYDEATFNRLPRPLERALWHSIHGLVTHTFWQVWSWPEDRRFPRLDKTEIVDDSSYRDQLTALIGIVELYSVYPVYDSELATAQRLLEEAESNNWVELTGRLQAIIEQCQLVVYFSRDAAALESREGTVPA